LVPGPENWSRFETKKDGIGAQNAMSDSNSLSNQIPLYTGSRGIKSTFGPFWGIETKTSPSQQQIFHPQEEPEPDPLGHRLEACTTPGTMTQFSGNTLVVCQFFFGGFVLGVSPEFGG
jgi:hypothetical protein